MVGPGIRCAAAVAVMVASGSASAFTTSPLFAKTAFTATSLAGSTANDHPTKSPAEAKPGKVYQWKAADDLPYEYFVPKSYTPKQGSNLTLILHGNGLDERWAFANHPPGEFRADDIVVSPDGTSYHEGLKNHEFLGRREDAERLHAFLEELRSLFTVKMVFLYGHSQGSFFVFYYAGEFPGDVDGVCGHASGTWTQTKMAKSGHHQAIGLLHGTDDHIPYGQSSWSRDAYEKAGYEHVHLRTLWDWPHAPHHRQAAQVLAWCEAMVSDDPDEMAASLEVLMDTKVHMGVDWNALHAVASRLDDAREASARHHKAAQKALKLVENLALSHTAAIEKTLGKKGRLDRLPESPSKASWIGVLERFREEFRGTPAEQAFSKNHKKALAAQAKAAEKSLKTFWKEHEKRPAKAFEAGMTLLERGATSRQVPKVLEKMKGWAEQGKKLQIPAKALQRFGRMAEVYEKGREAGIKAYASRNAKAR